MSAAVLFVPGLSILLGIYAYLTKAPFLVPIRDEEAYDPSVEVFIPALNEAETIAYAIVSLASQTVRPDRVTVVDDGSTDATAAVVEAVRDRVDLEIRFVRHTDPGSKTTRLKEVTRTSDADKIFVLDADTYLVSETYLERVIAAHAADDVACSFGAVYPDSRSQKRSYHRDRLVPLFPEGPPIDAVPEWVKRDDPDVGRPSYYLTRWPVEQYRSVLYAVEQRFFKDSQMRLIESTLFPVGCGVLYDREALREVFDDFEPSLGDQLTNSEDIFIGFSLTDRGYANVQVADVSMRTIEPTLLEIADQTYLWSSSFLQSAFYYRTFSRRLRSWTGDVTDAIPRDDGEPGTDEASTLEADGGSTAESAADDPSASEGEADRSAESAAVDVATRDGPPEPDGSSSPPSGGDWSPGRRRALSAIVGSLLVDGLYPTALLVVGLLTALGLFPLEILLAVVVVELALYCLVAGLFARRELTLVALLVSMLVRVTQLPIGVYVYARVGTDLLTGERDWNK